MSIFVTPLSQLSTQDLQQLLDEQAVENLRLEFKRGVPTKDETLKKLSAFDNTLGGFVVVGAEAGNDGRLVGLPGVDAQSSYKQTIVQWCFDGMTPPLDVDVSDAIPSPTAIDKRCYVVQVRESDLGPHFLNARKGVYVRSNEFSSRFESQLANENELRHLLQRRQLVRDRRASLLERARRRFDTFTKQRYAELARNGRKTIGARFDLCVVPRFPAQPICDHERLLSITKQKQISWRSVGFPRTSIGFISQHESVIGLRPGPDFSMLEVNTWGMVFYASELYDKNDHYTGMHVYKFLGELLVFLEYAGQVLGDVGYVGPLRLEMRLESLLDARWVYAESGFLTNGSASELDDNVTFFLETTTQALTSKRDALVIDLARYSFFATDWSEMATCHMSIERLVMTGYEYNSWAKPSQLRL